MQGAECVSMGARLTQQCLPVSERHCAVRWEEKKRNPKVEMRGAVLGAALRNHHANAERTLLQGKMPCVTSVLPLAAVHRDKGENEQCEEGEDNAG